MPREPIRTFRYLLALAALITVLSCTAETVPKGHDDTPDGDAASGTDADASGEDDCVIYCTSLAATCPDAWEEFSFVGVTDEYPEPPGACAATCEAYGPSAGADDIDVDSLQCRRNYLTMASRPGTTDERETLCLEATPHHQGACASGDLCDVICSVGEACGTYGAGCYGFCYTMTAVQQRCAVQALRAESCTDYCACAPGLCT